MGSQVNVNQVMFYTQSHDPHNRQLVATMIDGKQYRFTEGQMEKEMRDYALNISTLRDIEDVAFNKAITFRQGEREKDWLVVQTLLAEFQCQLDTLYG